MLMSLSCVMATSHTGNEGGQLGGPLFNINTRTGDIAVLLMVVIVMCYGYPPTQGMKVAS